MIDVGALTRATSAMLAARSDFSDWTVEHEEPINESTARVPWIGVYRGVLRLAPRSLGQHSRAWRAEVDVRVRLQVLGRTASETSNALDESVRKVTEAFLADQGNRTLGGLVGMLNGFSVEYFGRSNDEASLMWQMAEVIVTFEARTG